MSELYKLPKIFIAFLAMGGTIALLLMGDPPHAFCDTQVEHFKEVQKGKTYKDTNSKDYKSYKDKKNYKTHKERTKENCESQNSSGACYDYFSYLRQFLKDLQLLSHECRDQIFNDTKVKKSLEEALALITALAWRQEVIYGRVTKFNWLKPNHMALFCDLKKSYILQYGRTQYQSLEASILQQLPAEKINKEMILKGSILSESCLKYQI